MLLLKDFLDQSGWNYECLLTNNIHSLYLSSVSLGMDQLVGKKNKVSINDCIKGHAVIAAFSDFLHVIQEARLSFFPEVFFILSDIDQRDKLKAAAVLNRLHSDCKLISIQANMEADDLYLQCVNRIYDESNSLQQLVSNDYPYLVNLLTQDADIGEIEKVANKMLGNPMIITDESYKVVTYSKNDQVNDQIWATIVNKDYCPSNIVKMTDHNHFWNRLKKNGHPLFVDSVEFSPFTRRAVAEIKAGAKTKGYIALLEVNKKITPLDLDILQMIAELIGIKFKEKDAVLRAVGLMESELISDLLAGVMDNEKMAENRVESIGWELQKNYSVLCVETRKKHRVTDSFVTKLKQKLLSIFPFCVETLQGGNAFFIIGFETKAAYLKNMKKILSESDSVGYSGLPVQSLIELVKSYSQAKRTEQIVQMLPENLQKSFYSYHEIAIYHLLLTFKQHENILAYSYSGLFTLLEHDRQNGTEYIPTLRCFFENNQNVADTAEAMYLHRNSINYRLHKIRELLDDDFDDPNVRLHLNLSLMMLDLGLIQLP